MSVGESEATAIAEFAATFQATSFVVTEVWAQLHTGDPGDDGTGNIATETTRVDVSGCFGTAAALASPGSVEIANDATIGPWTSVAATETYTHLTFWDDETTGVFRGSATVAGGSVTAGDDFDIPAGSCVITKPVAV